MTKIFWYNIAADINEYDESCEQYQKQDDLKSPKVELKWIPLPSIVIKPVWVDTCNLREVDEYRHFIVLIDYFSKWLEAKSTTDKSAPTIAQL